MDAGLRLPAHFTPLQLGQPLPADDTPDEQAMWQALHHAQTAWRLGEVPVGAVVLDAHGVLIGAGCNRCISTHDPTAHAEIIALREAAQTVGNYRLPQATLVVTLEPCAMCVGAALHARLARLVYGARDPKTGACDSVLQIPQHGGLNHQTVVSGGVLEAVCAAQLRAFFRQRRAQQKRGQPSQHPQAQERPHASA